MLQIQQKKSDKEKNICKKARGKTGTIGQLNIYLAYKGSSGWCLYKSF